MSTKISEMTAATDLTDAVIPIVQDGVNKKASENLVWKTSGATYLQGNAIVQDAINAIDINSASGINLYSQLNAYDTAANLLMQISEDTEDLSTQLVVQTAINAYNYTANYDATTNSSISASVGNNTNPIASAFCGVEYDTKSLSSRIKIENNVPSYIIATNNITDFKGIQYAQDYSANYDNRSLADKEYVDTAVSDERLKENIVDVDSSLAKINSLRPVEFDMKKDGEHRAGFIAQELREVFPDMIVEGEYLKIKKDQLIPYMVKAIQELSKEVELLKSKI
jgi:hypothetical protein